MLKKDFGLKKNFLRVKQRADQGLGRAEKTEVLSEDLQNAEKKVEALKLVLQSLVKKLTVSLPAYNVQDVEKRVKRMPIVQLATSLQDNSTQLGEGMLSDVFAQCSMGLQSIGYARQTYELIVEKSTLAYFQQLLESDIPAIKKSKALLKQLTLDMDATRSRHQSASKESSNHPSTHNQNRTDLLNSDLEEAEHKVAVCKDQYATEMLTFISKESEICQKIIEWMDAKVSFYKNSLTQLDDMLPELRSMIDQHSTRPVYGVALDEHLQSTGKDIALVIEACISILFHDGMEEEGLFRIAGSASKLKKLKAAFNVGTLVDMEEYYSDFHVVAGALKQYIRELPEPLLTFHLFEEFLKCMSVKDRDGRLKQLWSVVMKLPKSNFTNVRYLIKFLATLAEKSDINKMTPGNIAIVFGPNLLWSQNGDTGANVAMSSVQNQVVETLILNHNYFFPGDVQFADVDSITSSPGSTQRMTSFGDASLNADDSKIKPQAEQSFGNASLSTSQLSVGSSDSCNSALQSPSTVRKNKKHAPPPPPTHSPQIKELPPFKPERPEPAVHRHESLKKPTIPPPGPPIKPVSRPNNPPPPTPQSAHGDATSGFISSNPFLEEVKSAEQDQPGVARSLSDSSANPEPPPTIKTHVRNASADIHAPTKQLLSPEVKGHNRTKSHDLKLRQPPPIPQRTHSIPAKHSSEAHKRLTTLPSNDGASPRAPSPSSTASSTELLIDLGQTTPTLDSLNEEGASESDSEQRARMNSHTEATLL